MHPGMKTRYDRLVNPQTGKMMLLPFDHGMFLGPLPGIVDPRLTVRRAAEGGVTGIIFNQGLAQTLFPEYNTRLATIHMLTNSCTLEDNPLFGSVERAVKWAADAVAIQILVGGPAERRLIEQAQVVLEACEEWNMPSLFMMYPVDSYMEEKGQVEALSLAARAGAEMGATMVKTAWAGSKEAMARVVESCPVPLVVAGGGQKSVEETFQIVRDAIDAGAVGIAMGRNVWGAADPVKMMQALTAVVHENAGVADALGMLDSPS